jgi:hypothetical protein
MTAPAAPAGWYADSEMVKTRRHWAVEGNEKKPEQDTKGANLEASRSRANAKEVTEHGADIRSAESPLAGRPTAIVDADAPAKRMGMPVPKMNYMHWPQVPEGNVYGRPNAHSWDR